MKPLAIPLERLAALFNRATPYRCTKTQRGVEIDVAGVHLAFDEASACELLESILLATDAAPLRRRGSERAIDITSASIAEADEADQLVLTRG